MKTTRLAAALFTLVTSACGQPLCQRLARLPEPPPPPPPCSALTRFDLSRCEASVLAACQGDDERWLLEFLDCTAVVPGCTRANEAEHTASSATCDVLLTRTSVGCRQALAAARQ